MVFSNFKWDHKADDCILIEYQKMSLIPHSALQVYYKGIFNEEGRLQSLLLLITINSFCDMYFYLRTS